MAKRWDIGKGERLENEKVDLFLTEVIALCKKHGLSLSHEDSQGGFIVKSYHETNIEWLNAAAVDL